MSLSAFGSTDMLAIPISVAFQLSGIAWKSQLWEMSAFNPLPSQPHAGN